MQLHLQTFTVQKRFALTISRGTTSQTTNVWVRIEDEGIEGWGEASPFSIGSHPQTTQIIVESLQQAVPLLAKFNPWQRQQIEEVLQEVKLPSAAWAGIDLALQDWLGKKAGLPLWKLWGLDRDRIVPTSVTIGISSPEAARKRVRDWFGEAAPDRTQTPYRAIKIKLGSPDGIAADKAMFLAVLDEAPTQVQISVDANGGWTLEDAIAMVHWLENYGIKYVEQPLSPHASRDTIAQLSQHSPLPIFLDESCFNSRDIYQYADCIQGINIKMMKSGGLTEATRMIQIAKACGLQIMFGCYSDSSLANTAASHLSPLADYLDLDSHLNLKDDPFQGAIVQDGCLRPNDLPGLGVSRV